MSLIKASPFLLSLLTLANHTAFKPQPTITTSNGWQITRVGQGGEPYVSTNDKGTVYVSSHIPTQVLVSIDKGTTFKQTAVFTESLGDMVAYARPDGGLTCSYMLGGDKGMRTQVSDDYGHTFKEGKPINDRPCDREWIAYDKARDLMYLIYSDGYIGGSKPFKGVYMSLSKDHGQTWNEISRIDDSAQGDLAVDPHLVIGTDGRLYAFWTITNDKDKIESYHVATSSNQGQTWEHQTTIAQLPHDFGDRQERWMLGGLCAYGKSTVTCFYVSYDRQPIEYGNPISLRVAYRTSTDGGATFGKQLWAHSNEEAIRCAKQVAQTDLATRFGTPWIEVEPWGTYDTKGKLYLMWFDNREGPIASGDTKSSTWHLRYVNATGQAPTSSRIGQSFVAVRPAMDYMCCTADNDNLYAAWSQNPNGGAWNFTGELWFGRLSLNGQPAVSP